MCECLSYEDGAEYLCEACGPRWREYEASIQRRPVTAPAPLDAAVREAEKALTEVPPGNGNVSLDSLWRCYRSLRSLLAAISADKRLEEAEAALRAQDEWERAEERHEKTCAYADCEFRGCPHAEVWAMRAHAEHLRRRYFAAFDLAAGEGGERG